jgi:hypothetical protein
MAPRGRQRETSDTRCCCWSCFSWRASDLMAFASATSADCSPPSMPAARRCVTSSSSSSSSWTALAILAVLPRLSVCQRTTTLPLSHTPLAPSPYQDQRPSHSISPKHAIFATASSLGRQEEAGRRGVQGKASIPLLTAVYFDILSPEKRWKVSVMVESCRARCRG